MATDVNMEHTTTVTVAVVVQFFNFYAPVFSFNSLTNVTTPESFIPGVVALGSCNANDLDLGDVVTYTLLNFLDVFRIDPQDGLFYAYGALNYSIATSYMVAVNAADQNGLSSTTFVYVVIKAGNDHAPLIDPAFPLSFTVDEFQGGSGQGGSGFPV